MSEPEIERGPDPAPGDPRTPLAAILPRGVLGGTLMGLANLVPGISGGTMLLAAGIYPRFIEAIARATTLRFDRMTVATLGTVGASAAAAIVLFAGPVKDLVVDQRWIMYSLFIGLTLGGVPVVRGLIREAGPTRKGGGAAVRGGAAVGFLAMAVLAWVQMGGGGGGSNDGWLLLFFAGLAGAAAMILPGVSGGYLLLVLGAYVPILAGVDGFRAAIGAGDLDAVIAIGLAVILPVGLGVLLGIVGVSHAIRWLLERYRMATLGVLLGLLVGAVVGLWPFQQTRIPDTGELIDGRPVEVVAGGGALGADTGLPAGVEVRFADTGEVVAVEDLPTATFRPTFAQVVIAGLLIMVGFGITVGVGLLGRERPPVGAA